MATRLAFVLHPMWRSVLALAMAVLALGPISWDTPCAASPSSPSLQAVERIVRRIAQDLDAPADCAALQQLLDVLTERGVVTTRHAGHWMVLTFDRAGTLQAVAVNAEALMAAPPLIQGAVIRHELEHLKSAEETRRLLNASSVASSRLHHIVRILVDDEYRAYRREILHVDHVVSASGGLEAYLATLQPIHRGAMRRYYQQSVEPFIVGEGRLDGHRLRRDFIFLETFAHRYPRYYEAALAWEALQGHVELHRDQAGRWRPTRLLVPAAFLSWLIP